MAPEFNKIIVGDHKWTMPIVCDDGQIRMCRMEEFADGFVGLVKVGDDWFTDWRRWPTSTVAIHRAAAFEVEKLG